MRRSAAPSSIGIPSNKRPKFSAPFKDNISRINVDEGNKENTQEINRFDGSIDRRYSAQITDIRPHSSVLNSSCPASQHLRNAALPKPFLKKDISVVGDNNEVKLREEKVTADTRYFNVVWCKASKKKHKKWDGDGILVIKERTVTLYDTDGKRISQGTGYRSSELATLKDGETLFVGGKEIEVMEEIPKEKYLSGSCFTPSIQQEEPENRRGSGFIGTLPTDVKKGFKFPGKVPNIPKNNCLDKKVAAARHNPDSPGAIVLPRPDNKHQWNNNKEGLAVIDVVVDPYLSQHLRPHQKEGVLFLYECVNGMRKFQGKGAILADEMGLGKTIQCITLIWTLLKQGMYGGKPLVKNVLVITPGSLVKNWVAEFKKWLGPERLRIFPVDSTWKVGEFKRLQSYPVMVISYEMFLRYISEVQKIDFELVICDEAHRLKNSAIKTSTALSSLRIPRRILLTGTPIQNDIQEFYTLADLANPGILGTYQSFKNVFQGPIERSQQPNCTEDEKVTGQRRAEELKHTTSLFFLRRTAEINKAFLPPRVEYVVFAKMNNLQKRLYRSLLSSRAVRTCLSSQYNGSKHLVYISLLRKLCNDPCLLFHHCKSKMDEENFEDDELNEENLYGSLLDLFPTQYHDGLAVGDHFGKLALLRHLLHCFKEKKEKAVVVSNFTMTLDVVQRLCSFLGLTFSRLDGKTPTNTRQDIVNRFNNPTSTSDVFLLSSKAGGTGLNLIGASRLVLYDVDWNPANDLQAMARVWRDGQQRTVYVYRILITGSIDEKMYQRQVMKQGLSGTVVDVPSEKTEFSQADLKDIFTLRESSTCSTHELIQCPCLTTGSKSSNSATDEQVERRQCQLGGATKTNSTINKNTSMAELMNWEHIDATQWEKLKDDSLQCCKELATFVFQTESSHLDLYPTN